MHILGVSVSLKCNDQRAHAHILTLPGDQHVRVDGTRQTYVCPPRGDHRWSLLLVGVLWLDAYALAAVKPAPGGQASALPAVRLRIDRFDSLVWALGMLTDGDHRAG